MADAIRSPVVVEFPLKKIEDAVDDAADELHDYLTEKGVADSVEEFLALSDLVDALAEVTAALVRFYPGSAPEPVPPRRVYNRALDD